MSSGVGPFGGQVPHQSIVEPDEVEDLRVGPMQRGSRVVVADRLGQHRVDRPVLLALVPHEVVDEEGPGRPQLGRGPASRERVDPVREQPDPRQRRRQLAVLGAQAGAASPPSRARGPAPPCRRRSARRAFRMTATSMASWRSGAGHHGQRAERGEPHRDERHSHPGDDALDRDLARPFRKADRLREPVQAIDRDHDVGSLGACGGAAGAHRHADVRDGEGRRVVDAVADHHHGAQRVGHLLANRLHLVRRGPLGQDAVHADRRADHLRDGGMIASHHHDPADPGARGATGSRAASPGGSGRPGPGLRPGGRRRRTKTWVLPSMAPRRRSSRAHAGRLPPPPPTWPAKSADPTCDLSAVHTARDARARRLDHVGRERAAPGPARVLRGRWRLPGRGD